MSEAIKKILDYWYTIELLKQDSFDKKTGEREIKKGDIIVASCWNRYKNRQEKCYYIVIDINDNEMTIDDGHTTYRKAVKALQNNVSNLNS